MRLATGKARPEHYVCFVSQYGFDQAGILSWVVLEIRILNDHDVAARCRKSGAAFNAFLRLLKSWKAL